MADTQTDTTPPEAAPIDPQVEAEDIERLNLEIDFQRDNIRSLNAGMDILDHSTGAVTRAISNTLDAIAEETGSDGRHVSPEQAHADSAATLESTDEAERVVDETTEHRHDLEAERMALEAERDRYEAEHADGGDLDDWRDMAGRAGELADRAEATARADTALLDQVAQPIIIDGAADDATDTASGHGVDAADSVHDSDADTGHVEASPVEAPEPATAGD